MRALEEREGKGRKKKGKLGTLIADNDDVECPIYLVPLLWKQTKKRKMSFFKLNDTVVGFKTF